MWTDLFFYALISLIVLEFLRLLRHNRSREFSKLKQLEKMIHLVRVETINNIHYWYDKTNGEFLCQGQTTEDMVPALKSRFPDHFFYLEIGGSVYCLSSRTNWKMIAVQMG